MHLKDPLHVIAAAILAGFIVLATKRTKPIPSPSEVDLAVKLASESLRTIINRKQRVS